MVIYFEAAYKILMAHGRTILDREAFRPLQVPHQNRRLCEHRKRLLIVAEEGTSEKRKRLFR